MTPNDPIDTAERLVRLETKLDFLITSIKKHEELEARVGGLERFVNRAVGAMVAINILITVFAYKFKGII